MDSTKDIPEATEFTPPDVFHISYFDKKPEVTDADRFISESPEYRW